MKSERKTLLGLIAAGRMSAAEAIRLEALWQERREWVWVVLLCVAACAPQVSSQTWKTIAGSAQHAVVQAMEGVR